MTGYRNSPVVLERAKGKFTRGADPYKDNLPKDKDDDENRNSNGAIEEDPAQSVGVKRRFQDQQDQCRTGKENNPITVAKSSELI